MLGLGTGLGVRVHLLTSKGSLGYYLLVAPNGNVLTSPTGEAWVMRGYV